MKKSISLNTLSLVQRLIINDVSDFTSLVHLVGNQQQRLSARSQIVNRINIVSIVLKLNNLSSLNGNGI